MEVSDTFEAGRIHKFTAEWKKLTRDPVILDIVQHCHLDINVEEIGHLFSRETTYKFSAVENLIISDEIEKLLDLKVIVATQREMGQVISPIFLRPKKDGGYRMVLNLRELNFHVPYKHFKMENFEQAIRLIHAGDYLASVDLRHAYYSVKIADEQQKFLCFKWNNTVYQFTCLPNGFSEGPRIFTKLLKPVFATLRERGHSITSFIDDTLICNNTWSGCLATIKDTIDLLQKLGFCINAEKSVLTPTRTIEYLGNVIDTNSMTITLPERRRHKIIQACRNLLGKSKDRIREVARVTGLLVAATPAVELGKLHYRKLETEKTAALQLQYGNFDNWMTITADMKTDLSWWLDNIYTQDRKIFRGGTDIDLYTDASSLGWGGHLNNRATSGSWSLEEKLLHINALELKAILFVLQTFRRELKGHYIKVYCDNTTAMTYVNEMGGTRSQVCNVIAGHIWQWCVDNGAWITCSHIPGKDNTLADLASRKVNDRHEWKLDIHLFQQLCGIFGTPVVDLFASRLNRQVDLFCSWKPDPEATYFDAFSLNWARFGLCYIFPPFSLITRCLQKMRAEGATGWIVVPLWMSQPWLGTLLRMLVDHPRVIMEKHGVLVHPSSDEEHPIMRHTRLMACSISGNTCRNKEYLRQGQKSSWPRGKQVHANNITHISGDGYCFVVDGISIPIIPLYMT